jgi:Icc-related predicted phosphoesterase
MCVAVITGIHGNLFALEALLAVADAMGVDGICCGGDLVGDSPTRTRCAR